MFVTRYLDRNSWIFLSIIALIAVVIPAMNLLAEPGSAFHAPTYAVSLVGKYLTYALLALSVDLIWGFCGILSLGHGAFFALGGLFIATTLFLPKGIIGTLQNWSWRRPPKNENANLGGNAMASSAPPLGGG